MNAITKGDKKNVILERRKPKTPQKENLNEVDGRDTFQTPNYATEIIIPFLGRVVNINTIWECAAGLGKIAKRLREDGFDVLETDLAYKELGLNFLTDTPDFGFDAIVTNPPFSLKRKFYERCRQYDVPFALLIPADYSGWIIDAVDKDGAEKVIPRRRIDYITPNTLNRIHEGEAWNCYGIKTCTMKQFKESHTIYEWQRILDAYPEFIFESIYKAPPRLLRKYSSSYYHSMWLTWGLGIGKSETFVELTNKMKDNI